MSIWLKNNDFYLAEIQLEVIFEANNSIFTYSHHEH